MKRCMLIVAAIAGLCMTAYAAAPVPQAKMALGFTSQNTVYEGAPGSPLTFEVQFTLDVQELTRLYEGHDGWFMGPTGWTFSWAVEGSATMQTDSAAVKTATKLATKDVRIDTAFITDADEDYTTKEDEGYVANWTDDEGKQFPLAGIDKNFQNINVRAEITDAKYGAENLGIKGGNAFSIISAGYQGLAEGKTALYKLKVDTTVPEPGVVSEIKFYYIDGMLGTGQPAENAIILGESFAYLNPDAPNGTNYDMVTKTNPFVIKVQAPPVKFNLATAAEGTQPVFSGGTTTINASPGDLVPIDVYLKWDNLTSGNGPSGWTLALAATGCTIDSATMDGITVSLAGGTTMNLADAGAKVVAVEPAAVGASCTLGVPDAKYLDAAVNPQKVLKVVVKLPAAGGAGGAGIQLTFQDVQAGGTAYSNTIIFAGSTIGAAAENTTDVDIVVALPADEFSRGDANADKKLDIADAVYLVMVVLQQKTLECTEIGSLDAVAGIQFGDAIYLIQYLFNAGPGPDAPAFPACGKTAGTTTTSCPPDKGNC